MVSVPKVKETEDKETACKVATDGILMVAQIHIKQHEKIYGDSQL